MYAQKASLAIDGKAMYFRGEKRVSGVGLRPSDFKIEATDFTDAHG